MNARYPQDDSTHTVEGDAAHWAAWELLAGRKLAEGMCAPNSVLITSEMLEGAELIVETVRRLLPNPLDNHVEMRLEMSAIHSRCWGTADTFGFNSETKILHIIDYKFGHRFVDEWFNPQALCYMVGAIAKLWPNYQLRDLSGLKVCITIVQPRCYYKGETVRSHNFFLSDAWQHIEALATAANRATLPNPKATTNPACIDCPGRHACSALQESAYIAVEVATDRQPHDLSPQAAATELRVLDTALNRLQARRDGLAELTEANLRAGKRVSGYHLESSTTRRKWKHPDAKMISIGNLLGVDLQKPATITPTQAAKLKIDESVISMYSVVPAGQLKLVQDNPNDVEKAFKEAR